MNAEIWATIGTIVGRLRHLTEAQAGDEIAELGDSETEGRWSESSPAQRAREDTRIGGASGVSAYETARGRGPPR